MYEGRDRSSDTGWAIAVLVILALVLFGFLYAWRNYRAALTTTPGDSTNINVSVPGGTTPGTPNTGPNDTGAQSGGSGSQTPGGTSGGGSGGTGTQNPGTGGTTY